MNGTVSWGDRVTAYLLYRRGLGFSLMPESSYLPQFARFAEQAEEHDRRIPDDVRVAVLKRDNFPAAFVAAGIDQCFRRMTRENTWNCITSGTTRTTVPTQSIISKLYTALVDALHREMARS